MTVPWLIEENCEYQTNIECRDQQIVPSLILDCCSSPIYIIENSEENFTPEYLNLHSCTEVVLQWLPGKNGIIREKGETLKCQPLTESAVLICYKYKKSFSGLVCYQRCVTYELVDVYCVIISNSDGRQNIEKVVSAPVVKTNGKHRKILLKSSFMALQMCGMDVMNSQLTSRTDITDLLCT